jgi:hypothetical protein
VAKSTSGKWVSRVGAQGGGKTYQKTRPSNYYGALLVIVVLGLALVIYSRFEYQNPVKHHTASVAPAIGSTSYAALSFQACGTRLPFLATDEKSEVGFIVGPSNVVEVHPISSADAGKNATLSQFGDEYPGMIVSSGELAIPVKNGQPTAASTYKSGEACPAGTKYAGQTGQVTYAYWDTLGQKTPKITSDPTTIKFVKNIRISLALEPKGVTPLAPLAATVNAMFEDATAPTTTTTLPTATTTAPTTTTTAPTTTTTKG